MEAGVVAAVVAAFAALAGVPLAALLSHRSAVATVRREVRQAQFGEILKKRMEVYPRLWRIHVHYETNWHLDRKPKTGAWAAGYRNAINELNLDIGVFFSQALYEKFHELRHALDEATWATPADEPVAADLTRRIREIVYGTADRSGLAVMEKDDLGSYRAVELQRRPEPE